MEVGDDAPSVTPSVRSGSSLPGLCETQEGFAPSSAESGAEKGLAGGQLSGALPSRSPPGFSSWTWVLPRLCLRTRGWGCFLNMPASACDTPPRQDRTLSGPWNRPDTQGSCLGRLCGEAIWGGGGCFTFFLFKSYFEIRIDLQEVAKQMYREGLCSPCSASPA